MANTLKLGNGKWATGKDTLMSFSDTNNNFKPLPFDFSRASSATVVNQSGLIETVGSGTPRIDFEGNTKGALLLEGQRTNLITYSNDFSQSAWVKSGTSVLSGFTSPYKTENAFKLVESSANQAHTITSSTGVVTSGATTTKSIIVKPNGRRWILLLDIHKPSSRAWFDLELGVVGSLQPNTISSKIEKLSNGYFRCSSTSAVGGTSSKLRMDIVTGNNITTGYQGDGTSGVYIYGAQLEVGSYPTSIIFTSGSAVTRVQDTCNQTVPNGVIGQTEGTVYLDFTADTISAQTSNPVLWYMKDGGIGERYIELYSNGSLVYLENNGSTIANITKTGLTVGRHKCVIAYKNNDMVFYVDGVQVGSDVSGTPSGFSTFGLQYHQSFYTGQQKVNQVKLYNTRLSNAELAALTTI